MARFRSETRKWIDFENRFQDWQNGKVGRDQSAKIRFIQNQSFSDVISK